MSKKTFNQKLMESEVKKKKLAVQMMRKENELTRLISKAAALQEKADASNRIRIEKILATQQRKAIQMNDHMVRQLNHDAIRMSHGSKFRSVENQVVLAPLT